VSLAFNFSISDITPLSSFTHSFVARLDLDIPRACTTVNLRKRPSHRVHCQNIYPRHGCRAKSTLSRALRPFPPHSESRWHSIMACLYLFVLSSASPHILCSYFAPELICAEAMKQSGDGAEKDEHGDDDGDEKVSQCEGRSSNVITHKSRG